MPENTCPPPSHASRTAVGSSQTASSSSASLPVPVRLPAGPTGPAGASASPAPLPPPKNALAPPSSAAAAMTAGKGRVEQEERGEGPAGERPGKAVLERPRADPEQRLDDQRQHRRLHAEKRRLDRRQPAVKRIDGGERGDDDRARQDEQQARRQTPAYAVQQPAGIGGELLRLRPRQQHAEIERMQETRLVEPALLLHHDAVHEGDLRRRPAETGEPDPRPGRQRLPERNRRVRRRLPAQPSQTCSGSGRPRKSSAPSGPSVSMPSISWISMSWRTCWAGCHVVRSNTSCSGCAP